MKNKNVLLIFTDQQRFDTIADGGNPCIKTPNLDRLCREGTRFSSAYTPSPVCVSARCSMHYGQYPMHTGCFENNYSMPEDGRPSVADVLAEAGYRTHAIGKRHFTPDPHALRGFQTLERQEEIVADAAQDDYLQYLEANGCGYAIEPHGVRGEAYYVPQISCLPPKDHPTQWVGDRTIEWLQKEGAAEQAFFLMSSFIHPHPPFSPPTPWHKLYRAPDMPLPKMAEDNESLYLYTNRIQNRYKGRDVGRDIRLHQLIKSYYWASISFIDYQVGRILEALEQAGQLDNTLIIFSSDHGEFLGDYNCFGKRSFLDSAARVPMICRLPGTFEAGAGCDTPVSLIDIMPTVLAAAGNCVEHLDGEDLAKVAGGSSSREAVFGHYQGAEAGIYMATTKEWKYIWSAADNKELLFDRIKDPDELRNRAYNVACGAAVRKMRKLLQDHIRTMPGHEQVVAASGWIVKEPVTLPDDPDAGLIVQDPPCFLDRLPIPGYSDEGVAEEDETGADFDPLKKKKRRLNGFTLIELLVVVCIIGLLAAVLVPGVKRSIDRARCTKCMSNQRFLAQCLFAYAQDHQGRIPPVRGIIKLQPGGSKEMNYHPWHRWIEDYGLERWGKKGENFNKALFCPVSGKDGSGGWPRNCPDYGINDLVATDQDETAGGTTLRKIISLSYASQTVLLADTGGRNDATRGDFRLFGSLSIHLGVPANSSEWSIYGYPAFRHPPPSGVEQDMRESSCNVTYCDGRTESIHWQDERMQTVDGLKRLFDPAYR